MKKFLIYIFLLFPYYLYAQTNYNVNAIDTILTSGAGYIIPRSSPINLKVTANSFVTTVSEGYILLAGMDGPSAYDNNLDGAIIKGNYIKGVGGGTHGIMAGYSINYDIRYNYFESAGYGIVVEGENPMAYTGGGITYNIFKNNDLYHLYIFGMSNVSVYNNTFYDDGSAYYILAVTENDQYPPTDTTVNIRIKNNIFYATTDIYFIRANTSTLHSLECDYNIYYRESGDHQPKFLVDDNVLTFAQWKALGFDQHSIVLDPNFIDLTSFVPSVRLDYGTDPTGFDYGLSTSADWIVGSLPDTVTQDATWQVGAVIYSEPVDIGGDYFVAPGGSNAGTGAIDDPWATFQYAALQAQPGDTVYFRGGVYNLTQYILIQPSGSGRDGTITDHICYFNYPGETPIFECENNTPLYGGNYGLYLYNADYIDIRGLKFRNIRQSLAGMTANGINLYNCTHIIFDNTIVHNVGGRGFKAHNSDSIVYINCDAYNCADSLDANIPGNGGMGFQVTSTDVERTGPIIYRGCRAWHCSDDGFDGIYEGPMYYENCWSWGNGYLSGTGNGYKWGWIDNELPLHVSITNSVAAYNLAFGISENNGCTDGNGARTNMHVYNNTVYRNGNVSYGYGFASWYWCYFTETQNIYRNNIAFGNLPNNGNYWARGYVHSNNSWDISGLTLVASDFASLDSTGISAARQADGSFPDNACYNNFLKLSDASQAIDKGTDVGLDYVGAAPDLGFSEYVYEEEPPASIPLVSTVPPTNVTTRYGISGGTAISDGGAEITAKGICWSTVNPPTTADSKTVNGTGEGSFTATITGLIANTTYYVRAYATNSEGTGYGASNEFTTLEWVPGKSGSVFVFSDGHIIKIE